MSGHACVMCQGPADEIDSHGDRLVGGFGSKHDAAVYLLLSGEPLPKAVDGVCDGCVDGLLSEGRIVKITQFGKIQKDLPAKAYEVLFQEGKDQTDARLDALTQNTDPSAVFKMMTKLVGMSEVDLWTAGMMSALLERAGYDVSGIREAYAQHLVEWNAESKARMDMIDQAFDEVGHEPRT